MLNNILNGYRPLIIKTGVILLLVFCSYSLLAPAQADPTVNTVDTKWICGDSEQLSEELTAMGETVILAGSLDDIAVFTLWVNPKTRSWSAVATSTKNKEMSCLIVHGKNLVPVLPKNTI
jgi:hypothetical protein